MLLFRGFKGLLCVGLFPSIDNDDEAMGDINGTLLTESSTLFSSVGKVDTSP